MHQTHQTDFDSLGIDFRSPRPHHLGPLPLMHRLQPGRHYTFLSTEIDQQPSSKSEFPQKFRLAGSCSNNFMTFLEETWKKQKTHRNCKSCRDCSTSHEVPRSATKCHEILATFRLCTDLDGSTGTMAMGANDFQWYVTGALPWKHGQDTCPDVDKASMERP